MKKILMTFLTCFLGLLFFQAVAQIKVQPLLPAVGLIPQKNLWNVAIMIPPGINVEMAKLKVSATDRVNATVVYEAESMPFTLNSGNKVFNYQTASPVIIQNDMSGSEFLSVGSYQVCYVLTSPDDKVVFTQTCVPVDVEALSPPQLTYPADSAVLPTQPTVFNWIPPSPVSLFKQLSYDILVTEKFDGQSKGDAIQLNTPVYQEYGIFQNVLPSRGQWPQFDTGKTYVWQVIARDADNRYAGKSQVWQFNIRKPKQIPALPKGLFIELANEAKLPYAIDSDTAYFRYIADEVQPEATIVVSKVGTSMGATSNLIKQRVTLIKGDNYFMIPLNNKLNSTAYYEVKLINSSATVLAYTIISKTQTKQ